MSIEFDGLDREDFRLSDQEIERCLSTLSKRDLDDIRFAQAQVRNFAEHQRASMKDVEVETLPGVGLALRSKFKTGPTRHRGITGFRTA
jgi:sulfopropanediol 3-dehydrogenase